MAKASERRSTCKIAGEAARLHAELVQEVCVLLHLIPLLLGWPEGALDLPAGRRPLQALGDLIPGDDVGAVLSLLQLTVRRLRMQNPSSKLLPSFTSPRLLLAWPAAPLPRPAQRRAL